MDSSPQDCVNPAELLSSTAFTGSLDAPLTSMFTPTPGANDDFFAGTDDFSFTPVDSAVDLHRYYAKEPEPTDFDSSFDNFFQNQYSTPGSNPTSNPSNTPSPHGDMIFSNANSPGEYNREQSQTSSPEANSDAKDLWDYRSSTDNMIMIPQSVDPPKVFIETDRTKTRAETQIKTTIVLDPLPRQQQWIRFPRHTLSKNKQLASDDEIATNEDGDAAVRLDLTLVCATAVEKPAGLERALKRARGEEETPTRSKGTQVSEIDKDDPAHPQNGGAVIICEGCKERERKRYDRKKKRNQEDEHVWKGYEDQRIIMINEKEFKRWQDVEPDKGHGPDAKKVEFQMRICCYCRHQEEKSPVGYKVIFTFKNTSGAVLAQKMYSEIIQITDDHKNRELPVVEPLTTDLSIRTPARQENMATNQYPMTMYNFPTGPVYGMYSQPTTPVMPQFQNAMSPIEGQFPQVQNQSAFNFGAVPVAPTHTPSFASHQRYQSYSNTPMLSPTEHFSAQSGYPLHRPQSLDSFATLGAQFAHTNISAHPYSQPFASQPPSRNVSRPASPSWDQGPRASKKMRAQPFTIGDTEFE